MLTMATQAGIPERSAWEPSPFENAEPPFPEPETMTVLAGDLRVGDVLVSAALGGIWNARVEAKRIEHGEVFLQLAGCLPVCLGAWEVVEVSP